MNNTEHGKKIIGTEEWCSLPGIGVPAIKARIDSGAKTSSLHAFNAVTFEKDGQLWIRFDVHPLQKNRFAAVHCQAPVIDQRSIKSSNGVVEKRYVISTELRFAEESWQVEITLTNRDAMGFRMLLGREAMAGRLVVDPEHSFKFGQPDENTLSTLYSAHDEPVSGLKIALLGGHAGSYTNERILSAGEERGHDMVYVDLKDCRLELKNDSSTIWYRNKPLADDFKVAVARVDMASVPFTCALLRTMEANGIVTVNSAEAIMRSRDEVTVSHWLCRHKVPITHREFSVQQPGAPPNGRDFPLARCLVSGRRVLAAVRWYPAGAANGQAQAASIKIKPGEKKLALRAAHVMRLGLAAVDILVDPLGASVAGVQPSPGLELIETVTGEDVAARMILALEKKAGWQNAKTRRYP